MHALPRYTIYTTTLTIYRDTHIIYNNLIAVVGWRNSTLQVNEGEIGVGVRVDLVKGNPSVLPTLLRFSYMESTGSATSMALSCSYKQHANYPHTVHVCIAPIIPLLVKLMLLGGTDYTRLTPRPLTLRRGVPPPSVTLTTNGDRISQEGDEDFFLRLNVIGTLPANLFLRDLLRVVIRDRTGIKGTPTAGSLRVNLQNFQSL